MDRIIVSLIWAVIFFWEFNGSSLYDALLVFLLK